MNTISYDEFGRRFISSVVTADRIEATLNKVVAGDFETGMKIAAGLVRAEGSGGVTRVVVDRISGEALAYRAILHVDLDLEVRVSGVPYRYSGTGDVTLQLHVVARDDLSLFVEIPDVTRADIDIDLKPQGRVAAILDQLGGVEEQVEREVMKFVNARKDERSALKERRIDVATTIDEVWRRMQSN
ncbi:MAG: hypothetical protein WD826_08715 [Actinomycetota bacterium]